MINTVPVKPKVQRAEHFDAEVAAIEVRTLERELIQGLRAQIDIAAEIGDRLEQARNQLPHGQFEKWLSRTGVKKTTAYTYRAVARSRREGKFPSSVMTLRQFTSAMKEARRDGVTAELLEHAGTDLEPSSVGDEQAVYLADARTFPFPTGIDIIATDPPWAKDTSAFDVVGRIAAERLAEDGLVLCQCGNASVGEALAGITAHGLRHLWTFGIVYPEPRPQRNAGFSNAFVPVIVAGRKRPKGTLFVRDVFHCDSFVKSLHPWQQAEAPWRYWLKGLAQREGIHVVDPFAGSGTIGVVCKELGFRFTGTEVDPKHHQAAANRIASAPEPSRFRPIATSSRRA